MSDFEDRLHAIKAEGRARRSRRVRRQAVLLGACGIGLFGVLTAGLLSEDGRQGSSAPDVVAAGDPADRCVNSSNPVCGDFKWDPEPERNDPLSVQLRVSEGTTPADLAFEAAWEDPDAAKATVNWCFDDATCPPPPSPCVNESAAGAWTPPAESLGAGSFKRHHQFAAPGEYQVTVVVMTAAWPQASCAPLGHDPYASTKTATVTVTVP